MGFSDYLGRFWYTSEPMFGVIMVVCFTSMLRTFPVLAEENLGKVLVSALFCCIAWGIVDGVFYAWEARYELKKKKRLQVHFQTSADVQKARELVEDDLKDTIVDFMDKDDQEKIFQIINKSARKIDLGHVSLKEDIITVLITFVLVVGSSVLVMLPFLIVSPVMIALKISNVVGILLLFFMGYWRQEDKRISKKLITGCVTAFVAFIVSVVTIILGG